MSAPYHCPRCASTRTQLRQAGPCQAGTWQAGTWQARCLACETEGPAATSPREALAAWRPAAPAPRVPAVSPGPLPFPGTPTGRLH